MRLTILARMASASMAALLLICASLVVAGCASSAESPEPQSDPSRVTGLLAVDAIIAAAIRGDTAALRDAIEFTSTACIKTPEGIGAPPFCRDGEAAGTRVDVIPLAQCEGFFSRPDEFMLDALAGGATLYAVYRATTPDQFPPGKYWAIFARPGASAQPPAFAIVMSDDHVVGIHFGCDMDAARMVEFERLTDVVVPPVP